MFKFVLVATLLALVMANEPLLKNYVNDVRADGFETNWDLEHHSSQHVVGDVHGNMQGSYEYITPEGEHVKVTYTADENGYHPEGEWIPTPPPIPDYILKAIKYIESHPHPEH
ncbi:larval cuticle protein 4-like [Musca vetustissima]|uniref:larval cuticle protein 4-like n=1 Tax=Musca vetustissima TaxID=27455 RepID=UPI002AB72D9C|nr:larval cuticle protein 4-like [Musca vetustissima]XP_061398475.1 larval cuticle protein 4-like [Musca vetustissima]